MFLRHFRCYWGFNSVNVTVYAFECWQAFGWFPFCSYTERPCGRFLRAFGWAEVPLSSGAGSEAHTWPTSCRRFHGALRHSRADACAEPGCPPLANARLLWSDSSQPGECGRATRLLIRIFLTTNEIEPSPTLVWTPAFVRCLPPDSPSRPRGIAARAEAPLQGRQLSSPRAQ